jgi:hypothetical protein
VDRIDVAHPRRSDLTYVLDADTGRATWLSHDAAPEQWTRRYVTTRTDDPERTAGLAEGPVWLGPAPTVQAAAPEVTLRSRGSDRPGRNDTIEVHVSSPRSASSVVLRVDQHVDDISITAPGMATTDLRLKGTQPGRWPTEVSFGDLPAEGIDLALRIPHQGPVRIAAYDLTPGLSSVPGFVPRPEGVERSRRSSSDTMVVRRTYEF